MTIKRAKRQGLPANTHTQTQLHAVCMAAMHFSGLRFLAHENCMCTAAAQFMFIPRHSLPRMPTLHSAPLAEHMRNCMPKPFPTPKRSSSNTAGLCNNRLDHTPKLSQSQERWLSLLSCGWLPLLGSEPRLND